MALNKRKCCAAVSGALLAAAGANVQAATVQVSSGTNSYSGSSYDFLFPTVANATDLLSISTGTVVTGEYGSLTISAIIEDGPDVGTADDIFQIFSKQISEYNGVHPLSDYITIGLNGFTGFTDFPGPSGLKGLRFTGITGGASGAPALTLSLPTNTILTIAVPEPVVTMLIFCGLLVIAMRRNGMVRQPAADQ